MIRERDYYFDNVKWLMVLMAITVHVYTVPALPLWLKAPVFFHYFTSVFAMPALLIVSGHLCRGREPGKIVRDSITRYLAPYLLVQSIWAVVVVFTGEHPYGMFWATGALWYLLVISWLRLMWAGGVCVGRRLNLQFSSPATLVFLAALFGVVECTDPYVMTAPHYFGIYNLFLYFPFFFIGTALKREHFTFLSRRDVRLISAMVLIAWSLLSFNYPQMVQYFSVNRQTLPDQLGYMFERIVGTVAVLSLIPQSRITIPRLRLRLRPGEAAAPYDLTEFGQYTLYPYVFHIMFLWILASWQNEVDMLFGAIGLMARYAVLGDTMGGSVLFSTYACNTGGWWQTVWTLSISVMLFFGLSSAVWRRLTRWIVEPTWIWKGQGPEKAAP